MPMAAAVLANGQELSRLIVPKALLLQTAQTAQLRLGGLVGREICHIPFSRQTPKDPDLLHLYSKIHQNTRAGRGLILTSHDHILSYQLSGMQCLADGKNEQASIMIGFQDWLDRNCRDVLDECDFTLAVKTQLNYPSGSEEPVDGHPFRWKVAQDLLSLVAHHVTELKKQFPRSIEVRNRAGWFPVIQFLKSDVEDELHSRIMNDVCAGNVSLLRLSESIPSGTETAIRRVLSEADFDQDLFNTAAASYRHPDSAAKILLVIRGFIIHKILVLCLNKRWNVQYGLHPNRAPVAVPFEAKGKPSEQAEFGHPDVAIIFTCLAFYYTGLNDAQFSMSIQHVLTSNDPAAQYEMFISECPSLPEALRHWNVINLEDDGQKKELWKHLHQDRMVVDCYLNEVVFPAHARQFTVKLQASAWDLPLTSRGPQGKAKTTGFSGTNDNRTMLPLTIQQDDLRSLSQTNAEVLTYLLQPRNRSFQVAADITGGRLSEQGLLEELHRQNIRILIDAGAYVLEMDNRSLAKMWMGVDGSAKAAVFFGPDDRTWVMFRDSTKCDVPLLATPFMNDLSECLVYFDEAHTRGVDLQLPPYGRAALTLALRQTKDFTVQGMLFYFPSSSINLFQ